MRPAPFRVLVAFGAERRDPGLDDLLDLVRDLVERDFVERDLVERDLPEPEVLEDLFAPERWDLVSPFSRRILLTVRAATSSARRP